MRAGDRMRLASTSKAFSGAVALSLVSEGQLSLNDKLGEFIGYTQFMAASPNGRRSVTVSVNSQLTPTEGAPGAFKALRRAEERAVCAALTDR
jgi:Beta-lactamase